MRSKEDVEMAVAGLVIGIVSLVLTCFVGYFSIASLPLAIVGLVLSVVARKKKKTGVATAGMVVGIIAVIFTAISFFTCGICVLLLADELAAAGL